MNETIVSNLSVSIGEKDILRNINFSIKSGETIGLIGPNGSGKTTLMRSILGLQKLSKGEVFVGGENIKNIPKNKLAKQMAFIPQGGTSEWPLTVENLVALGRLPYTPNLGPSSAIDQEIIQNSLNLCGLTDLRERRVTSLSGGEWSRACFARAISSEPNLLLADEPIAFLDPKHCFQIIKLIKNLAAEGKSALVILHDLSITMRFFDRVIILKDGKLVAVGSPNEVMSEDFIADTFEVDILQGQENSENFIIPWKIR